MSPRNWDFQILETFSQLGVDSPTHVPVILENDIDDDINLPGIDYVDASQEASLKALMSLIWNRDEFNSHRGMALVMTDYVQASFDKYWELYRAGHGIVRDTSNPLPINMGSLHHLVEFVNIWIGRVNQSEQIGEEAGMEHGTCSGFMIVVMITLTHAVMKMCLLIDWGSDEIPVEYLHIIHSLRNKWSNCLAYVGSTPEFCERIPALFRVIRKVFTKLARHAHPWWKTIMKPIVLMVSDDAGSALYGCGIILQIMIGRMSQYVDEVEKVLRISAVRGLVNVKTLQNMELRTNHWLCLDDVCRLFFQRILCKDSIGHSETRRVWKWRRAYEFQVSRYDVIAKKAVAVMRRFKKHIKKAERWKMRRHADCECLKCKAQSTMTVIV